MSRGCTPELGLFVVSLRHQIHQDSIDFSNQFPPLFPWRLVSKIAYPKAHFNRQVTLPLDPFHKAEALKDLKTTRLNAVGMAFEDFFWALVDNAAVDAVARCP